jgi:hypothetical protein
MGREPTELKLLSDRWDAKPIDVSAVVLHPQWRHLDVALLKAEQSELPEPLARELNPEARLRTLNL